MENLLNIIYAVILSVWSFRHPNRFVMGYLVYVSSYGGWFPNDILVGGVEYGEFLVHVLALAPVVFSWREIDPTLKKVILFLALFYLYGVVKPMLDGHQGWMLSVKSSKSMTAYFFLFYVLAFSDRMDWNRIFRFVTCLGLYYAVLYLVNKVGMGIRPPSYVKDSFLQCPYDSFMLLALCCQLMQEDAFRSRSLWVMALLMAGIYIGGYFSLTVTAGAIAVGMLLYRHLRHPALIVLLTGGFLLVVVYAWGISSTFLDTWKSQQSALDSRTFYNEFRWALIAKELWGGYGFLSRDTRLVSLNAGDHSSYMSDLSFIDAGYVDLMGRFGLIGIILFLLVPLYFVWRSPWNRQTLPLLLMLLFYYAVNITWSVFSYPHGIIVLALVYAYLYQKQSENGKNTECNIGCDADGRDGHQTACPDEILPTRTLPLPSRL